MHRDQEAAIGSSAQVREAEAIDRNMRTVTQQDGTIPANDKPREKRAKCL